MIFITAILVFVFDRLTKALAMNLLTYGAPVKIVPGIFNLTLVFNDGTAFGLLKGSNAFLTTVSVIVIFFIAGYAIRKKAMDRAVIFSLGLILGGALGNLFDRIKFGNVIDFLDFRVWPVFNIADSGITIGVAVLAWKILVNRCIRSC